MSGLAQLIPPFKAAKKRPFIDEAAKTNDFVASSEVTKSVAKGRIICERDLLIQGTLTTPAAPAGTVRDYGEYELVDKYTLAVGEDTIISASGLALHVLQCLRNRKVPYRDPLSAAEAGAAATATVVKARLRVGMVESGTEPEHSGLLNTGLWAEGKVKESIKWGAGVSNLIDGAAVGTTFTSASATMSNKCLTNVQQPSRVGYGTIKVLSKTLDSEITATNAEKQVSLQPGQVLHWIILISKLGANLNLSDVPLTATGKIRMTVGGTEVFSKTVDELRAAMRNMLPENFPVFTGILPIPFIRDEEMSGMDLQVQGEPLPSDLPVTLYLPITGAATNQLEVVTVGYRDPITTAAAQGLV